MMEPRSLLRRCGRSLAMVICAGTLLVGAAGCQQFIALSYFIFGPPSIEPQFDAETGLSLTDYGATVAVVCYADNELKWDFDKIDFQIAKHVSYRLAQHQIHVLDPDRVRDWLDQNPDWDRPQEIGEALGVTHVVYIDVLSYSLHEPNSHNLYRGRSEARVSVFEMDEDMTDGEKVFDNEVKSVYPIHTSVSTSETPYATFKQRYIARLSEEIGRLFYEHYAGDDIPDGA